MKSIRARLTLWLVSAFAILFTGVNGLVYFSSRQFLYHEFDGALKAKAMAINTLIKQVDGKLLVDFSDKFLTGFGEKAGTEFFEVWLPEGTVLRRSSSLAGADLPRKVGTPNLPLFWNLFSVSGFPVRAVGLDFTARMDLNERQHHPPTEAMIVVASDRRELDRSLSGLALTLTIATILGVILTVPVVHLTLRRGHEPLDRLGHAASAIHAEFLEFRF